ncbi:MAG: glycosyltransferase family 39 protein [Chloroflexi bacterium]|nr:glycosyltransferase family 39 protein [Chloroflexota bacterium]
MQSRTLSVPSAYGVRVSAPTWPAETVVLGLFLIANAAMRLVRLSGTSGDLDEGIRGMQLLLMSAGYRPMQEIYSSQGPLLLDMLFPFYRLFGETLGAARLAVGVYSLLGIVGVYAAARAAGGPVGGVVAALLLTLSPNYLRYSRQALAEVPALAPAILAVAAAFAYQRTGRWPWLVISGLLLGTALLIKPIVLPAVVAVALAALFGPRLSIKMLLLVGLVSLAVVAAIVFSTGFSTVMDQMVEYRLRSREASGWNLAENLKVLRTTLVARDQWGLFALGGAGALLTLLIRPRMALPILGWMAASGALLAVYAPLFPKHVVIAVPPLVVAAGAGVGATWQALRDRRFVGMMGGFVLVAPLLLYAWSLPGIATLNVGFMNLDPGFEGQRFARSADIAGTIAALSQKGDFVVTDEPEHAFLAQRLVPPDLADPSSSRVRARQLTGESIVTSAEAYNVRLVSLAGDRFRSLRNFRLWIDEKFEPIKLYGRGGDAPQVIYLRNDVDMQQARRALEGFIQTPTAIDFGGTLRLTGFSLDRRELTRNGNVGVTYEWEALTRAGVDYHAITELVGPDGQTWSDEQLSLGGRGAGLDEWTPGRWLFQSSTFDVSATAPAGEYVLRVGIYDSKARADLPITAGDPRLGSQQEPIRRFELARIRVQ